MIDFDVDSLRLHGSKPFVGPSATVFFTFSSIFIAFLYAVMKDFLKSYVKAPKHFPPRGWLVTFRTPSVDAPLVEVSNGDFREALERGSRLVRYASPMIMMN